jgi:hypothetical protein
VVFPKASAKTKRYRPKFSRCLSNENQSVFPQQSKQYTNINNFKLTDTAISTNSSFTDYLGNNPACAPYRSFYCNTTPSFLLFLQVYGLRLVTCSNSDHFLKFWIISTTGRTRWTRQSRYLHRTAQPMISASKRLLLLLLIILLLLSSYGAPARIGPWPPLWGFSDRITHVAGLLWTSD